jgi:hypothetical protein
MSGKMIWATTIPTKSGYYWCRTKYRSWVNTRVVKVFISSDKMSDGSLWFVDGNVAATIESLLPSEWAGPIEVPHDPG